LRPTRPLEHASFIEVRRKELQELIGTLVRPESRLVWEVGCGHGHFLTAFSKANPSEICVGVDISSDRIGRAARKRTRAKLGNLHFIRADAEDFLACLPDGTEFTTVFILFPDPWPKRRHHKNRVVKSEFLDSVAARCRRGARIYFRTDHEGYFRDVFAQINAHPNWKRVETQVLPVEEPTVFEKRASSHFTLVAERE
jgi:tRNA (guanine-N7-)-methyltransferase